MADVNVKVLGFGVKIDVPKVEIPGLGGFKIDDLVKAAGKLIDAAQSQSIEIGSKDENAKEKTATIEALLQKGGFQGLDGQKPDGILSKQEANALKAFAKQNPVLAKEITFDDHNGKVTFSKTALQLLEKGPEAVKEAGKAAPGGDLAAKVGVASSEAKMAEGALQRAGFLGFDGGAPDGKLSQGEIEKLKTYLKDNPGVAGIKVEETKGRGKAKGETQVIISKDRLVEPKAADAVDEATQKAREAADGVTGAAGDAWKWIQKKASEPSTATDCGPQQEGTFGAAPPCPAKPAAPATGRSR